MKPSERNHETELDPEVERHLDAIDRALAGEPTDPDLADLADLARDLRALREEPRPEWRAELDSKTRAGFGGPSPLQRLRRLLPSRPGRVLAPAGALATALVVVAVGVSQVGDGEVDGSGEPATTELQDAVDQLEAPAGGSGEAAGGVDAAREAAPDGGRATGSYGPGDEPLSGEAEVGAPGRGNAVESTEPAAPLDFLQRRSGSAPGKDKRQQDRRAVLALKTGTDEVREVSDRAIQITESAGGVVLSSQLSERESEATARLELSLPTRELDSVLDQLTDLATVETLNEAAIDITRPFVSARDRLRDARAERRQLLRALGNASSDEEAEALRRQLRQARREISRAEAAFDRIARRARTSNVSLTVNGSPGGDSDDGWDLGEAADDALSALKAVAGVLLISAAILAPLALLIAVALLIASATRKRRRDRALDEE